MMFRNFIGGEWLAGTQATRNVSPSNIDDVIGEYAQADSEQACAAIQAAAAAFPAWSVSSIQLRATVLDRIGNEILERLDELGTLLAREEGKTKREAHAEVNRAGQIFKFFSGECLRLMGETVASVRDNVQVDITREPVGVVSVITPWNFPIAIPAWKIAPALAYGNCVVFKPADLVPGCAWALAEIIQRSALPHGVFNLVMGRGSVIGDTLVTHADVAAVSFTGSTLVGHRIAEQCGRHRKRLQLEMGGKNPQVILDDAELDVAVELSIQSAFFSTGQRCTASSRLIVTAGIHDRFLAAMKDRMRALRVGDALLGTTDIGPAVSVAQLEQNLDYVALASREGAVLESGGEPAQCHSGSGKVGHFLRPTLFSGATSSMRVHREEIFGPVATLECVKDYDAALAAANDTNFGLAAGIATTSLKHATHFKRHAQAGMVMVNLPTAGVDFHVPFGGRKDSSFGPREQGSYAKEFFTTVKTSYVKP